MTVKQTSDGYIIQDLNIKYALNQSKKIGLAPYYLMRLLPSQQYISGMFKSKNNPNLYQGKTKDGQRVRVYINTLNGTGQVYFG